jgi:hypothetical protein
LSSFAYVQEWDDSFLHLFPHRYDYIWATHPQPGQRPIWKTESRHPLSDRLICQGAYLYGVRFGRETNYLLIDIDAGSHYHPRRDPLAIARLLKALESLGLVERVACTSSYSGGIHLYFPFVEAQNSYQLADAATTVLEQAGFVVAAGQLELFPNLKLYATGGEPSLFNAHRLPLQSPGSYLLNVDWETISTDSIEFVRRWQFAQNRNDLTSKTLTHILKTARRKRYRLSTNAAKFLADLDAEIEPGWTGRGQTNYLLGRIAMREYVFRHLLQGGPPLVGEALATAIVQIAQSLPGFTEWCSHQHEIGQKAQEWARSIEASHYYHYGERSGQKAVPATPTWNQQQADKAKERIRTAIVDLLNTNALPAGITARRQALTRYGISHSTLSKYKEFWHPVHLNQSSDLEDVSLPEITDQLHPDPSDNNVVQQAEALSTGQLHSTTTNKLLGLFGGPAHSQQAEPNPTCDLGGSGGISTGMEVENPPDLVLLESEPEEQLQGVAFVQSILRQIQTQQQVSRRLRQQRLSYLSPPPDETYFRQWIISDIDSTAPG